MSEATASYLKAVGITAELVPIDTNVWRDGLYGRRHRADLDDHLAELHHRLEKARSLFHLEQDAEALEEIDACVALAGKDPALARFRPLALHPAALYHLATGDHARALALYDELLPLVEATEPWIAFTKRTDELPRHPGEIANLSWVTPREQRQRPALAFGIDDREPAEGGEVPPPPDIYPRADTAPVR